MGEILKTKIFTASPRRTRERLSKAGLDPNLYEIGPFGSEWTDANLDDLIRRDVGDAEWQRRIAAAFSPGCCGG